MSDKPKIDIASGVEQNPDGADISSTHPAKPERQMQYWERVAWLLALIGGVHTAFTTWMDGWKYINERRDLILGIGKDKPLPHDLAELVFQNDWITCVAGFCIYVAIAFGLLWWFLVRFKPMQDAILNPFGTEVNGRQMAIRRKGLKWLITVGVLGGFTYLLLVCHNDASDTKRMIGLYCPANTNALPDKLMDKSPEKLQSLSKPTTNH